MSGVGRRILVDASGVRRGGGLTYLVNLVPELARAAADDHFGVLVRDEGARRSLPEMANLEVISLPETSWPGAFAYTYLRAAGFAREWRADLFFSTAEFSPPCSPCPSIASFRNPNAFDAYDHRWRWHQRVRLRVLRFLASLSARHCDRILFVSADSARWIGDAAGVPSERRAVVHHGVDVEGFARVDGPAPLARPYVLSVSTIYRYKNFVALIEAWTRLAERQADAPDLVIIGDDMDPAYSQRMRDARAAAGALAERIHLVGEVPYAEVRVWYAHAAMFAFPSYLETFGHPLLEALAAGLPVVAADIPVFREIAGDAARYHDPHDIEALARELEAVASDREESRRMSEAGRERAQNFSWANCAKTTLALFDSVLEARGAR